MLYIVLRYLRIFFDEHVSCTCCLHNIRVCDLDFYLDLTVTLESFAPIPV